MIVGSKQASLRILVRLLIFTDSHRDGVKKQTKNIMFGVVLCVWLAKTNYTTECPDLYLHDVMHCVAATYLSDWIIL